ncbi:MAG TPA: sugar phosphate isomerase/epimerase family protein [Methanomassiliicoccales archaeon]|nr:sugar phosphate isomerase/epimerase family protein [Methanomassiliicoccales archaeon]
MRPVMGMPALIELSSVEENTLLCQELGLSFVELNMNMPYCFPENLPAANLRRMRQETGVHYTMHMPDDLDLGSFHETIREGTVERAMQTVDWAGQADIRLLNFHINPGIYFTLPDFRVWIYDKFFETFERNMVSSFSSILDRARDNGVKVSIENVCNFDIGFIQRVLRPLMRLPGLGLTWDVGHDARTEFKEQRTLMLYEDRLAHMHLHDYDGRSDHQVLFTGRLDIMRLVMFASAHNMSVVLETKTIDSLIKSMENLNKRF